jgi:hypothetical protein
LLREQLKEQLRRGTGAEADFHPWLNKFERPRCRGAFETRGVS